MKQCKFYPGYAPKLDLRQTQQAIKVIKDTFQVLLAQNLHLERVTAPVLVAGPGRAQLKMMQWGFPLGDTGRPVINARAETAASKPSFSITRCIFTLSASVRIVAVLPWARMDSSTKAQTSKA